MWNDFDNCPNCGKKWSKDIIFKNFSDLEWAFFYSNFATKRGCPDCLHIPKESKQSSISDFGGN